jgi:hypothetical protein
MLVCLCISRCIHCLCSIRACAHTVMLTSVQDCFCSFSTICVCPFLIQRLSPLFVTWGEASWTSYWNQYACTKYYVGCLLQTCTPVSTQYSRSCCFFINIKRSFTQYWHEGKQNTMILFWAWSPSIQTTEEVFQSYQVQGHIYWNVPQEKM